MKTATDRKFGIEIECYVPSNNRDFQTGDWTRGIQINNSPRGWNGKSDSSLGSQTTVNGIRYRAIEVVSPILAGLEGLAQIYYVLEMLESAGAIVNGKCGIHIHVDGSDGQLKIRRVVNEFRAFESVLYGLCGEQASTRKNNHYCYQSSMWPNPHGEKYHSLNVKNMRNRKQTFEFRLFAAKLDVFYILTAVYAVVALVTYAINATTVQRPTMATTLEAKTVAFVNRYWRNADNLIISDEPTKDIEMILAEQVRLSI